MVPFGFSRAYAALLLDGDIGIRDRWGGGLDSD
jgi:hypothetical protein